MYVHCQTGIWMCTARFLKVLRVPVRQGARRVRPPIGQNQGVQFPLADALMEIEAANLMRFEAARRFDAQEPCGAGVV